MRFYTKQHLYYCGVDSHARSMFICIIDNRGDTFAHKNIPANRDRFCKANAPYREDIGMTVQVQFLERSKKQKTFHCTSQLGF